MLLKEPLKQILIDGRDIWDNNDTQPFVRETFRKMIRCRTAALGWQVYASDTEERRVYHTCKARSCPGCGYRATLQWQREQWTQLPDISYSGLVFTMPGRLWHIFKENRHLLHDLPTLGSEAVLHWVKEKYGVQPLILVVPHTFGRHLNFNAHLHMLVSAGGLMQAENRWIGGLNLNPVGLMKLWRHAVITYLRLALRAGILKSNSMDAQLRGLLARKYEVGWHVNLQHRISKRHFLGYDARYIRRPPIAQHRFRVTDGPVVKFVTKDTVSREIVLDEFSRKDFLQMLADHVPEKYRHSIRYYGLLAPRTRNRALTILYRLLGQKRRVRPRPLCWAELIKKSFGWNPLVDRQGQSMRFLGKYFPAVP